MAIAHGQPAAVAAQSPYPAAQPPMPVVHAPPPVTHHGPPLMPAPATSYPAAASTPVAPVAAAPRRNSGLIIGVLGALALVAAIAIVLVGRCGTGGDDKAIAKQGTAVPVDAAVVAVVVDAPVAPLVDAAVVAAVADAARPPADARPRPPRRDAGVATAPIDPYAGPVPVDAGVAKVVPKPDPCAPKGTASCIRAMKCQNSCEDDDHECRCQCRATVDPSNAPFLDAFAKCSRDCGWANMCQLRKCGGVTASCLAR